MATLLKKKNAPSSSADNSSRMREFTRCSGMHTLEAQQVVNDAVSKKQVKPFDDYVLFAMLNSPKEALEMMCSKYDNLAVYSSLILSSSLGLVFNPPSSVNEDSESEWAELIFIFCSLLAIVLHVTVILIAVEGRNSTNRLLRDSDIIIYLYHAGVGSKYVDGCFSFGLIMIIPPMIVSVHRNFGIAPALFAPLAIIFIPLATFITFTSAKMKRHSHAYWRTGSVGKDSKDPYDLRIAYREYQRRIGLGERLAARDKDGDDYVDPFEDADDADDAIWAAADREAARQVLTATVTGANDGPLGSKLDTQEASSGRSHI